jgi:hypothetical protein
MSVNIRYPNITGQSEREQITQIKSYLHQLVEQLNYALPTIGSGDGTAQPTDTKSTVTHEVQGSDVSYYEFRSLIIQELQKVENLIDELEQARDNGEFNGTDGKDGVDGKTPNIAFTMDEYGNLYYEVEE